MKVKQLSLTALIAALYAALVVVLAPISFGPIQLRIADSLIPTSAILGWPAIFGVALGAIIGNTYFFISPIDIIFGALANFLAGYILFRYRVHFYLAAIAASIILGFIVGGYLWLFFPPPDIFGLSAPVAMIISITFSSLIAVSIIGVTLVEVLRRSGFIKQIESLG